jgi:hypothetical protein
MIWNELYDLSDRGWRVIFAFIFSHVGVAPNEAADKVAREAGSKTGSLEAQAPAWIIDTVRNRIPEPDLDEFKATRHFRVTHDRDCKAPPKESWNTARSLYDLAGERLLARIRCSTVLKIDKMPSEVDRTCPLCDADTLCTEHIFFCRQLDGASERPSPADIFGSDADKLRKALRFFMNALHRFKVLDAATGTTDAAQVSCAP